MPMEPNYKCSAFMQLEICAIETSVRTTEMGWDKITNSSLPGSQGEGFYVALSLSLSLSGPQSES